MNRKQISIVALLSLSACASLRNRPSVSGHSVLDLHEEQLQQIAPHTFGASCDLAYNRLVSDGVLEVRMAFGYKDARPARFVGDRYERNAFVAHILKNCEPGYFACGFERDPDDADRFFRTVNGIDGAPVRVELRVSHSSVGPDDTENRKDGFQAWQSRLSETNYLDGLKSADVVFYNGHSRDGGGPDFTPPRILPNSHVDYPWYHRTQPGLTKSISTLGETHSPPALLGLFSCVSGKHFSNAVNRAASDTALITSTKLLYYADAMGSSIGALNALLGRWCEPAFEKALQPRIEEADAKIQGFFWPKTARQ